MARRQKRSRDRVAQLARRIGYRVRQLRQERGWVQEDLAAHMEPLITRSGLSLLETGRSPPSMRVLVKLAEVFEIPVIALLLDPEANLRDRVVLAVAGCPEGTLAHVAKLVDID